MLFMSITFVIGQFLHMKDNRYSIPNVSLVMLGLQALGYVLPLITDAEILFKWKKSEYFKVHPLGLEQLNVLSKSSTTPQKFFYRLRFCLLQSFSRKLQHLVKDHVLVLQQRGVFQMRSWFSWSH